MIFDPIKCEPLPLFDVAAYADYWAMDQHVALPDEGGWVVRAEWNRMRRGRTHESQSWVPAPHAPARRPGTWRVRGITI